MVDLCEDWEGGYSLVGKTRRGLKGCTVVCGYVWVCDVSPSIDRVWHLGMED